MQLLLDQRLRAEERARAAFLRAHQACRLAHRELHEARSSELAETDWATPVFLDVRERAIVSREAFLSCVREEEKRSYEAWMRARTEAGRLAIVRERAERRFLAKAQRRESLELDEVNRALLGLCRTAKGWMG